jgi:hypothetical protein
MVRDFHSPGPGGGLYGRALYGVILRLAERTQRGDARQEKPRDPMHAGIESSLEMEPFNYFMHKYLG